jgi:hypothetical protein
MKGIF